MAGYHKRPGSAGVRWSGRRLTEWRANILRNEPLCRQCKANGINTPANEVDHITPLEHGGTYDDDNAQPLCTPCHKAKTAKDRGYRVRKTPGPDGWPI